MTNLITNEAPGTEISWKRMTVGLDVSDKYISVCVIDPLGEVAEEGRIRTSGPALIQRFTGMAPSRIVLEVGVHSPWISRLLAGLEHEVIVANPRRVRLIAESTRKNDRSDAETLARLGRIDPTLLNPVAHRSPQAQADLAIIRARRSLVSARTLLINHVRGAVKSTGARLPACDAYMFHRKVAGFIPKELLPALAPLLTTVAGLTAEIAAVDKRIVALIRDGYPEAQVLQQVPGVGPLIALTFVLTIGDPGRFRRSRQVGAYLGLVPRQRSSGDHAPELGISKAGDSYLRQLLVNGAQHILGYRGADTDLRRWGLQRVGGGGRGAKKRAVVAVARKLAVLLHRLWVTRAVYVPLQEGVSAS